MLKPQFKISANANYRILNDNYCKKKNEANRLKNSKVIRT